MKQWEEYRIPAEEVRRISRIPITCLEDQTSVFSRMALEMAEKIEDNNRQGKRTVFIIPFDRAVSRFCGPGQHQENQLKEGMADYHG